MALVTPTIPNSIGRSIKRRPSTFTIAINRTLASCDILDLSQLAGAAIKIPTGVTAIACYGNDVPSGTFAAINDSTGTAASITVTAGQWYDLPAACFAFPYLKIVSTTADGDAAGVGKT